MDYTGVRECTDGCLHQPQASGLMSLQFGSATRMLKLVEIHSLYKRWLWVTPRVPNVNNEWDPSVMEHNLSVQFNERDPWAEGVRALDRTRQHE